MIDIYLHNSVYAMPICSDLWRTWLWWRFSDNYIYSTIPCEVWSSSHDSMYCCRTISKSNLDLSAYHSFVWTLACGNECTHSAEPLPHVWLGNRNYCNDCQFLENKKITAIIFLLVVILYWDYNYYTYLYVCVCITIYTPVLGKVHNSYCKKYSG